MKLKGSAQDNYQKTLPSNWNVFHFKHVICTVQHFYCVNQNGGLIYCQTIFKKMRLVCLYHT